jgi:hypothetical protein
MLHLYFSQVPGSFVSLRLFITACFDN